MKIEEGGIKTVRI